MEKKTVREQILSQRLTLSQDRVTEMSVAIQDRLLKSLFWPLKGNVCLYAPIKNEVNTQELFQRALERGLRVFFPRVERGIGFYETNGPEDLVKGSWGIMEPKLECPALGPDEPIALLVVPGVAFTPDCYRVGYGRRFYDEFIMGLDPDVTRIGLCYEFQVVRTFDKDQWDQPVSGVMTEKSTYLCPRCHHVAES